MLDRQCTGSDTKHNWQALSGCRPYDRFSFPFCCGQERPFASRLQHIRCRRLWFLPPHAAAPASCSHHGHLPPSLSRCALGPCPGLHRYATCIQMPGIALFGLVGVRIALLVLVFGGGRRGDDCGSHSPHGMMRPICSRNAFFLVRTCASSSVNADRIICLSIFPLYHIFGSAAHFVRCCLIFLLMQIALTPWPKYLMRQFLHCNPCKNSVAAFNEHSRHSTRWFVLWRKNTLPVDQYPY